MKTNKNVISPENVKYTELLKIYKKRQDIQETNISGKRQVYRMTKGYTGF